VSVAWILRRPCDVLTDKLGEKLKLFNLPVVRIPNGSG